MRLIMDAIGCYSHLKVACDIVEVGFFLYKDYCDRKWHKKRKKAIKKAKEYRMPRVVRNEDLVLLDDYVLID